MTTAIIIPVLNDAHALRRLLGTIRAWSVQPAEIVVAAGGEDDEIAGLSRAHRCRHVVSQPCRGKQLDDGARAASAEVLWFVHADALPSRTSLADIGAACGSGTEAGFFRFEFMGPRSWHKTVIESLVALRTRCGGMPYGDQGLWVSREAYMDCGGFSHEPLFEEVRLMKRLRARGRVRALHTAIGVAPRRWERDGWWYRSIVNRLLALGHTFGIPPARLASRYYTLPQLRRNPDA